MLTPDEKIQRIKGRNKAIKALNYHFSDLIEKSDLYQAYMIGYGNGLFALYEYVASEESIDYADKVFSGLYTRETPGYNYFIEAVEKYKAEVLKEGENE